MDKCIIITSFLDGSINDLIDISNSYIICADGGYVHAANENITPDIVMGDFDSLNCQVPDHIKKVTVPSHKDITDTQLCIEHAIKQEFTNILILGGIGGRLDHTIANIQNIISAARKNISIMMLDAHNIVLTLIDGNTLIPAQPGYTLSLFSFSSECLGVTVSGVEYPLNDYTLTNAYPLGVSNEFKDDEAYVEVKKGELLIILSSDS